MPRNSHCEGERFFNSEQEDGRGDCLVAYTVTHIHTTHLGLRYKSMVRNIHVQYTVLYTVHSVQYSTVSPGILSYESQWYRTVQTHGTAQLVLACSQGLLERKSIFFSSTVVLAV